MTNSIPNILHFCYFGGRPFSFFEYLCIKSACDVNRPEKAFMYVDIEPEDPYWRAVRQFLDIVPTTPPDHIGPVPIPHPAHQTDIVRLEKLIELGGIYLDTDILCVRPFTPLLKHSVVLGKEFWRGTMNGHFAENAWVGLGSAVILAQKDAPFLHRWLEGFDPAKSLWRGFRSKGPQDRYYSEISIKYSRFLAENYPEEIHIENRDSFYYPGYTDEELAPFFESNQSNLSATSYCHHLWADVTYKRYLKDLTEEKIKSQDTNFTKIARRFL